MTHARQHRIQVVAHRGASEEAPEHTLAAYRKAIEDGADALECDVRLTADGHLVCVHDRDLRRTASSRGLVSTMNLAELDELDFARWKNPWSDMDDEAPELDPAARALFARYATERTIERVVMAASATAGGMAFIGGGEVAYLLGATRALAFHPPSRAAASGPLAAYLAGEPLAL